MPGFQTVNRGTAWSDVSGQNTSERVRTERNRSDAEIKLSQRKIEVRTGANVTRARGPWVSFKRFFTAARANLPRLLGGLSATAKQTRTARHAEYKFDRCVNKLVEMVVNTPQTSAEDVSKTLNEIANLGEIINANSDTNIQDLKDRFAKNFQEALVALGRNDNVMARTDDGALMKLERAFSSNGALSNLNNDYSRLSSISYNTDVVIGNLDGQNLIENNKPMPVKSEYNDPLNPKQHDLVQEFISSMKSISTGTQVRETAQRDETAFQKQKMKTALHGLRNNQNSAFNGSATYDLRNNSHVNEFMNVSARKSSINFDGTDVSPQFIADANRMPFFVTDSNGEPRQINHIPDGLENEESVRQMEKSAVQGLKDVAQRFNLTPELERNVIKNLSSIAHQNSMNDIVFPMTTGVTTSDIDAIPILSGEEKLMTKRIDISADENGVSIKLRMHVGVTGFNSLGNPNVYRVDPNRNSLVLNAKLHVGIDELVQERATIDIQECNVSLNVDLDGNDSVNNS